MKCGQVQKLFFPVLRKKNSPVNLLNSARFLQFELDNSLVKAQIPYEMSVPIALKARFYYLEMALLGREVGKK